MTRYLYLTAGTLDCTGALDGWTITSPTARACAPDDDLLLRRGDVITLDGEVYRPAGYRPSTYDERLVSASVERPVWVRIGRVLARHCGCARPGRTPVRLPLPVPRQPAPPCECEPISYRPDRDDLTA